VEVVRQPEVSGLKFPSPRSGRGWGEGSQKPGGAMKKFTIAFTIMTAMIVGGCFFCTVHAQAPATADAPTFYRLTPGVYVNPWPRFTIHYPKDWVERRPDPLEVFRASAPGPAAYPAFAVAYWSLYTPDPPPLDKLTEGLLTLAKRRTTDITVISDKPSRLRDGTPAREIEFLMVLNGAPLYTMPVATRDSNGVLINTIAQSRTGRVGDDLKAILYSRQHQPDKDKPVKVPPDIQSFLDNWRGDIVSHDLVRVMTRYSDRYLDSVDKNKTEVERFWGRAIDRVTSLEVGITDFIAEGDKAYLAGFWATYLGRRPLAGSPIIKENGEWKWYGNQRNPPP
jgi:hypothetical protein